MRSIETRRYFIHEWGLRAERETAGERASAALQGPADKGVSRREKMQKNWPREIANRMNGFRCNLPRCALFSLPAALRENVK